jgi:hypothetical protein
LTEPKIFFAREPNIENLQDFRKQGDLSRLIDLIMPDRILKPVPQWRSPDLAGAGSVRDPAGPDAVA